MDQEGSEMKKTKPDRRSNPGKTAVEETGSRLPTIPECRQLSGDLRGYVERLEEETARAHERVASSANRNAEEGVKFLQASTTVVLTIAAGLMEVAAERSRVRFVETALTDAARDSAEYVQRRKDAIVKRSANRGSDLTGC
jgi:hypothetical protein